MNKPAISVLLCVYNPEKEELYEAVQSIIQQSMEDWELLLYDDGSGKEQERYISEIVQSDSRIKYYRSEKNCSLAYGLNKLVGLATGKYIARMDADDRSHPKRLEKCYQFLEAHPEYSWVGSNTYLIDQEGKVWGVRKMPEIPDKIDFLKYSPYIHPAVMFRTEVLRENHYTNHKRELRGEDYELFMRLHADGMQGYNLQEELFYYRETADCYKRRKWSCQVREVSIRWHGFRELEIHSIRGLIAVIKPIIVWLLPNSLILNLKKIKIRLEKRK